MASSSGAIETVPPSGRNSSGIREIEVSSRARISDTNSSTSVALSGIRNEDLSGTARTGRVGLVALAVVLPEDVAFPAPALTSTRVFPEFVNLSKDRSFNNPKINFKELS